MCGGGGGCSLVQITCSNAVIFKKNKEWAIVMHSGYSCFHISFPCLSLMFEEPDHWFLSWVYCPLRTPQKASFTQCLHVGVCFLGEANLQQCDFLEMDLAAFWTMTYLKCSMKQNKAGRQIWSWTYTISLIKAESYRQIGLPPSQP